MGEENREKRKHRYIGEIIDTDATVIATRAVPSGGAGGAVAPPKNRSTFLRMRIIFV